MSASRPTMILIAVIAGVSTINSAGASAQTRTEPTDLQAARARPPVDSVDFARQIRPILAENCFECHGPDQKVREAKLRLDTRAGIFAVRDDHRVVVPGRPEASELVARIMSDDEDERMPPADSGKTLTDEQKILLSLWIRQGANYAEHWSFEKPRRPPAPKVKDATWPRNIIDHFILARLEQQRLRPAPEADRATLVRRLSLDLTGLPPTVAEVDAFVEDRSPGAYVRLVDRLLASPRYGEHMARPWLDLARYADTNGYERDHVRNIWAWRDWVIHALNEDMPFDQFTIDQLAGDLLPNPTANQLIATGFHRNSMLNRENGIDVEEFRVAAVKDRVETTGIAWLGLSIGCAQCHDHKFDPITQEDYYRLYALFNQDAEELRVQDINGDRSFRSDVSPRIGTYSPLLEPAAVRLRQELATLQKRIAELEARSRQEQADDVVFEDFEKSTYTGWTVTGDAFGKGPIEQPLPEYFQGLKPGVGKCLAHSHDMRLSADVEARDARTGTLTSRPFRVTHKFIRMLVGGGAHQDKTCVELVIDGKVAASATGRNDNTMSPIWLDVSQFAGRDLQIRIADRHTGGWGNISVDQIVFSNDQSHIALKRLRAEAARIQQQLDAISPATTTLVMRRAPQARATHIQVRGNFLTKGKPVRPGVPSCFQQLPARVPADRLALARWLVDPDHPRTTRVVANRIWAHHFGRGLVETLEDLGTQSPWPTHPQLLDALATQLVRSDWSLKAMHRLVVLSATYRQSSVRDLEKKSRDPRNELFSSFPRQRLSAEQIRDNALSIGGLLSPKMGGPGVFPHQPKIQSGFHGASWDESQGEDRYRRAIYTFWRRTAPYASFVTFDAPTREICSARRIATNTALGALDLLNDPVFVDAARGLAGRMVADGGQETERRIAFGFRLCVSRVPRAEEVALLRKLYDQALASFQHDANAAGELANSVTLPLGKNLEKNIDLAEMAAWILVANTLLNLDETITRE